MLAEERFGGVGMRVVYGTENNRVCRSGWPPRVTPEREARRVQDLPERDDLAGLAPALVLLAPTLAPLAPAVARPADATAQAPRPAPHSPPLALLGSLRCPRGRAGAALADRHRPQYAIHRKTRSEAKIVLLTS